ncbi:NaeI family type II restriction endonuclease [Streptomyces sp. CC208A]|uniref:NaeI family type II restriction endonuclease n=1 Tax=Streptomyces sp. CC208A TaxID=3044573 RepID=UPI0024A9FB41|nr:NaeI family type II restriction endonuclease [Streptomyces sp. CC208A]
MARLVLQGPGARCANTDAGKHILLHPEQDLEAQAVFRWLKGRPLADIYTESIRNSIDYVLDGGRTGRFYLLSPEVHPGERASVGAKLEYEILRNLSLPKTKPLDTEISGIPVDIKATVGSNWAVPSEAHCQLCLCTQIQLKKNRHRTWLVRAHRSWLYRGKGNKDGKRGLAAHAREHWSVPLYDWTPLPVNPLRYLPEDVARQVLAEQPGQVERLLIMFRALEGHVIPRSTLLTVARSHDPMRRAREVKRAAAREGLTLLCGRDAGAARGISLQAGEWIAVRDGSSESVSPPRPENGQPQGVPGSESD